MIRLDSRDLEILRVLSREGRITKAGLAERINLSASPAWERLRRLEKAGIIEGYGARISLRSLGSYVTIFVMVELEGHTAAQMNTFERAVQPIEEVTACWALGGGFDYLMQVTTRDIDSYQRLIDGLLEARVGLARYFTHIVTKPIKQSDAPPLAALLNLPKD